jgi:hypothetical protein
MHSMTTPMVSLYIVVKITVVTRRMPHFDRATALPLARLVNPQMRPAVELQPQLQSLAPPAIEEPWPPDLLAHM